MKRFATYLLAICVAIVAHAIIPIDHNTILNDNPQPQAKPIDEEDPYFLLTGEADKAIAEADYLTAIDRLREAIGINPDNPSNALLYSNLGSIYNFLGQDSLAIPAYNKALEIAPAMSTVRCNRGIVHLRLGNTLEAYEDFSGTIDRDSTNVTALYYRGMMALYEEELDVAIHDFKLLESLEPGSIETCMAMSSLYSMTGQEREAIPYYKELIAKDPSPEFYAALAGCYLVEGEFPEASATLAEGFRLYGEDPELYYYRAWLNRESYLLDAAKKDAKRAIELGADPVKVNQLFQ